MKSSPESGKIVNSMPGVTETLALLDKLKGAVQDFAAREEKLEQEFRARAAAENRGFETASREQSARQAQRLAEAEAEEEFEQQRWQARFQRRKVRINEAHKILRRRAVEDVSAHE